MKHTTTREEEMFTKDELAEQANQAYQREFLARDIQFGKCNFKGGREVFAGALYIGYILRGQFVTDRRQS